ncbi:unnamed protein product [Danaus chrysippus]|uniref:(African queen) hypothetical protein n=1 Tax=Danaus chrysippus TaxID=151541 RepID=A0A8J2RJD5_9NEOP|nr:unnamed protein product [Danaus chrysippus]
MEESWLVMSLAASVELEDPVVLEVPRTDGPDRSDVSDVSDVASTSDVTSPSGGEVDVAGKAEVGGRISKMFVATVQRLTLDVVGGTVAFEESALKTNQ